MSLTYLVLAHDQPAHLGRLLSVLLDGSDDRAVVHVDRKRDALPFAEIVAERGLEAQVAFLPERLDVRWAGFAMVEATLGLLRAATRDRPTDAYVLLSGADYPIKPVRKLRAELEAGRVHIDTLRMPDDANGKPLSRLEHRFVAPPRRDSAAYRNLNRVLRLLPKRNIARGLEGLAPHAGTQWWAMPHDVAESVLRFVDEHPKFVRFYKRSTVPDESFFQTIIADLVPDARMRPGLTYANWTRIVQPGSPAPLDERDFETLRSAAAADRWFARKFDCSISGPLLAAIDSELLGAAPAGGVLTSAP